jgi:glycosyltransferase involved in cell wall biosynthesis
MTPRIVVCNSQVPFARGGAELHVESLRGELAARGFEVDVVTLPFAWSSRRQVVQSALAWRMIDLAAVDGRPVDLAIATRFPSYAVRHPNKVVWLIHQFRQVYDLLGTPYSDFDRRDPLDARAIELVRAIDRRALGEARARFTNARNTAERLRRFNDLDATPLYHPPKLHRALRAVAARGGDGGWVLGVGRLDPLKRFDLLVEAMRHAAAGVRCRIAGDGPELPRLRELVERRGLGDRVELLGFVDDERLVELYAGARAVFYAPFDEDFGYVTLEAFSAGRPVVTCADSGGVLEFVTDGETGLVCPPGSPRAVAERLDRLWADPGLAAELGRRGAAAVREIGWDRVVEALNATL